MFDFFLRKREVILDCFTTVPAVYDHSPINYATKFLPDWWKETPAINDQVGTIKNCVAFMELYKTGIIIPCWSQIEFNIDNKNKKTYEWRTSFSWECSIAGELITTHSNNQFHKFSGDDGLNLKIISPWAFRTNKLVHFSWNQPTWHMRNHIFNMNILPAVTNFYSQHATNINMFFEYRSRKQQITIDWLTPLAMLHPLSNDKIKIKNHLISEKEMQRFMSSRNLYFRRLPEEQKKSMQINNKLRKHYEKFESCPYKPKVEESK